MNEPCNCDQALKYKNLCRRLISLLRFQRGVIRPNTATAFKTDSFENLLNKPRKYGLMKKCMPDVVRYLREQEAKDMDTKGLLRVKEFKK